MNNQLATFNLGGKKMNYEDILSRVDEQKKSQNITNQLYRYTGLIQAIQFFSQRFSSEQILNYTYDFVTELLIVKQIAIFSKQYKQYFLIKSKGFKFDSYTIPFDEKYNMIAKFHGHIMNIEDMNRFLPQDLLKAFPSHLGIPLMIEDELFGFILANRAESDGDFTQDDYIIAEALMQLFNTSLSNYKSYQDLHDAKSELDEKIFNLFAINQSSKVLLSELNLPSLYNLSIDVFSELTQSSITAFFLYDEISESYLLRGMKDAFHPSNKLNLSLYLESDSSLEPSKSILDMKDLEDIQYFNSVFHNGYNIIQMLNPVYIVMLIKNKELLGFVTLGKNVAGRPYNKGIFELIESLASSSYIALSNAKYFKQTNEQKKLLQNKFNRLVSLNSLMKNINSAHTIEQLANYTLNTIEVSFGMKTGLFALFNPQKKEFQVLKSININECPSTFPLSDSLHCLLEGENFILNSKEQIPEYIPHELSNSLESASGSFIAPISIDNVENELLGIIAVFEFSDGLLSDSENVLTINTIANHISPVLFHLNQINEKAKLLSPNYENIFLEALEKAINEAEELFMDLELIHIHNPNFSFAPINLSDNIFSEFKNILPITKSDIFIIDFDSKQDDDLKSIIPKEYEGSIYKYKKDFTSLESFKNLFNN